MDDDFFAAVIGFILLATIPLCGYLYFSGTAVLYSRTADQLGFETCHYWTPFSTVDILVSKEQFCKRYIRLTV